MSLALTRQAPLSWNGVSVRHDAPLEPPGELADTATCWALSSAQYVNRSVCDLSTAGG